MSVRDEAGSATVGLRWIDRLQEARSPAEVLDIVRVFLAQYSPQELVDIPQSCRPRKLFDANDLAEYALDLMHEASHDARPSPLAMKMIAVVSRASMRISELVAIEKGVA
jgi:hypothetical protein